jgi:hypothetical protein
VIFQNVSFLIMVTVISPDLRSVILPVYSGPALRENLMTVTVMKRCETDSCVAGFQQKTD